MAARNFVIVLTDGGDEGSGPYTGTLYEGGSYTPGTSRLAITNSPTSTPNNLSFGDIVYKLQERAKNLISRAFITDPNN